MANAFLLTILLALVAKDTAQAKRGQQLQDSVVVNDQAKFGDVDSEMSALLAKTGVIREDHYNKPGNLYTLHIQGGDYRRSGLLHGTFKFGGWYGGLLAGGSAGGLPGMAVGGMAGMKFGDKAAETLLRAAQGQVSIVRRSSEMQVDMKVTNEQPLPEDVKELKDAVEVIEGRKISGTEQDLSAILTGLSEMLDSPDQKIREEAIMAVLTLEIARRGLHHNVLLDVE